MFLWDCVSMFDTEKGTTKPENIPTTIKDMDLVIKENATISKINKLQKNVKRQLNDNIEDKVPKVTTVSQETEQINEHAKLMEGEVDVDKGDTEKAEEPKKYVPTKNQPGEEDVEPSWEEKAKTPPFLLTLEILNHKVHNYLQILDHR